LSLIAGNLRHPELLRKFTNLLVIGSKSKPNRTKGEHTSSSCITLGLTCRYCAILSVAERIVVAIVVIVICIVVAIAPFAWPPSRRLAELEPEGSAASVGRLSAFARDWSPARWADLLPFQPALEASKVQNVATWKLLGAHAVDSARVVLGIPQVHLLTADDARVLLCKIALSSIRVLVHLLDSPSVPKECVEPLEEVACRHEQIPHDMDRKAIEHEKHHKEGDVDTQLDHICRRTLKI
jgi:hypothetical protein